MKLDNRNVWSFSGRWILENQRALLHELRLRGIWAERLSSEHTAQCHN